MPVAALPCSEQYGSPLQLAGIEEYNPPLADGLADPTRQLPWHGISAEIEFVSPAAGAANDILIGDGFHAANRG